IALQSWFLAEVLLQGVITVQMVIVSQREIQVARSLIDIHRCDGRTVKSVERTGNTRSARSLSVFSGEEGRDLLDRRIASSGDLSLLVRAEREGTQREPLPLPKTFITGEKEGFVSLDWSARCRAEIVADKWRHGHWFWIEKVSCIEKIVPHKIEDFPMEVVRAGTCEDVSDCSGVAPVFRRKCGIVDFEFRNSVDGGLESNLVLDFVAEIDAINHPVCGVFALSCRIDCEGSLSAQWCGEESILRRGDGTRNQ